MITILLYRNMNLYIISIIGFAINKAQTTRDFDIRKYVIVFDKNNKNKVMELKYLETLVSKKSRIKLIFCIED